MLSKESDETTPKRLLRLFGAGVSVVILVLLIWSAGRAGFSSLLSNYAAKSNQLAAADAAVRVRPEDPEAHFVRGAILEESNDLPAAIAEFEHSVRLRPEDYVLWLSLAHARELNGDVTGAIAAGRVALTLAPYYAQPHWQLGNLLVRAGQREEGFQELRRAGASDPTLLPSIVDLAWQLSGGNVQYVQGTIAPQSPEAYVAVADYFRKRGAVADAIANYSAAGSDAEPQRRQYLAELFAAKRFKEAYALWAVGHPQNSAEVVGLFVDAGFEQETYLDEAGFGWRRENKAPTVALSLDAVSPREGKSSLSVEFSGESDPAAPIISQLVLVEPNRRYQLSFAARSEGVVSGGLPRITVVDAGNKEILGQSSTFPEKVSSWQDYTIEFNTKETTAAIHISLQRERCSKAQCPIFGRVWLDRFALKPL